MDLKKDAYGQEVLAHYNGEGSFEVVERDDGYIGISMGCPVYFADYKDWPKDLKQAIKYVKGRVLDIGTGAGRAALYLQDKGHEVIAIDNSPLAIQVCKKRGVKKAKVMPIEEINKFKLDYFDTILMLGSNFGLFGNYKKAKRLLKVMYRITAEDALIIAESRDVYKTKDPGHIRYHERNKKKGRMAGQIRIRIRFKDYIGDWFDYLQVSKSEMKDILEGTGWRVKKFIDSEDSTYIAVIEKT